MRLQEGKVMMTGLAVAAALALLLVACKGSNTITAPSTAPASAAANFAGAWTGTFQSYSTTRSTSPMSATFQQNGSDVTGSLEAVSCGIRGAFRGTVTGNQLTGRVGMHGCLGGYTVATVSESGLSLTIGDFTKPVLTGDTIVMYGGAASLHR